jgi:hypothetical protein
VLNEDDIARLVERLSPEAHALFWEVEEHGAEAEHKVPALELGPDLVARISAMPVGDQREFFGMYRAISQWHREEGLRLEAGAVEAEGYAKLIERAKELDRQAGRPVKEDMTTGEAVARLEEAGELGALERAHFDATKNEIIWVPVDEDE